MSKPTLTPLSVSKSVRRVLTVYQDGDKHLDATMKHHKITPACTGTCYGCCKQVVAMHLVEGIVLAHYVRETRTEAEVAEVMTRADASLALLVSLDMDRDRYFRSNTRCALLDEQNQCTAYEARPMACRGYAVVSDPALCEPSYEGTVSIIGHPQFDVEWMGAVVQAFGLPTDLWSVVLPLPKALACGFALLRGGEPALRDELATFKKGGVFR